MRNNISVQFNPLRSIAVLLVSLILTVSGNIARSQQVYCEEKIVAGGPEHFMEVRHVVLKGTNYQIGKKIAEIAKREGIVAEPFGDPLRNRVQRAYIENSYPILYERMKGVADAYGLSIENDIYDFSSVGEPIEPPACSAVFYPGQFTRNVHGILSRNYDFTTGNLQGKYPGEDEKAVMARPFIFEIYPDNGYPSLYINNFDYLGGTLDGINSEGVAVAVLAEAEAAGMKEPSLGIGMHELMCMRYLLDNCKDVTEAKQAMLYLKHYYIFLPCHYIIADKFGKSFVFEFSPLRNRTFMVDGDGPQCVTNHLISKYDSINQVPKGKNSIRGSFSRLEILRRECKKGSGFSLDEIKKINAKVADQPYISNDRIYAPGRTLWHSIYDLDERKLSVKFYLGEKPDPKDKKKVIINYSDYVDFKLDSN